MMNTRLPDPMMMLCHEHDKDPAMRPNRLAKEARRSHHAHAAGLVQLIGTFGSIGKLSGTRTSKPRRSSPKSDGTPVPLRLREEIQTVLRRAMVN